MNKEAAKKWIEALRSGKYRQGIGTLRRENHHYGSEYCCLGVLCDLYAKEFNIDKWELRPGQFFTFLGSTTFLPSDVKKWIGITDEFQTQLMSYNDNEEYSFEQIADVIKEELN